MLPENAMWRIRCEGPDAKDPMWRIRCERSDVNDPMWTIRYEKVMSISCFPYHSLQVTSWHNMEVLVWMGNHSDSTLDQVERWFSTCFHCFCFIVLFSRFSWVHVKPSVQLQISVIFFVYKSVGISLITSKTLTSYLFWIPVPGGVKIAHWVHNGAIWSFIKAHEPIPSNVCVHSYENKSM